MTTPPFTLPRHREQQLIELTGHQLTTLHSHVAGVKSIASNQWIIPGWMRTTVTTFTFVVDFLWYQPILVTNIASYDRIGIEVSTLGAGSVRLGIYEADVSEPKAMTPAALILDAGTVSVATTGVKQISISQTLKPGFYFLALATGVQVSLYGSGDASGPMEGLAANFPSDTFDEVVLVRYRSGEGAGALADPADTPLASQEIRSQSVALRQA